MNLWVSPNGHTNSRSSLIAVTLFCFGCVFLRGFRFFLLIVLDANILVDPLSSGPGDPEVANNLSLELFPSSVLVVQQHLRCLLFIVNIFGQSEMSSVFSSTPLGRFRPTDSTAESLSKTLALPAGSI
jgi:hypothetical protein